MKTFIRKGYFVMFFSVSDKDIVKKTMSYYFDQDEIDKIYIASYNLLLENDFTNQIKMKYFFYMSNNSIPNFRGFGNINIFHCQFPFDTGFITDKNNLRKIFSYQHIIINSEYTEHHIKLRYKEIFNNSFEHKLKIIYPPSINKIDNNLTKDEIIDNNLTKDEIIDNKNKNMFVMIGRIFGHDEKANNKYFDVAIKIFNRLIEQNNEIELIIIGSVKNIKYYEYLCKLKKYDNIKILTDLEEEKKIDILKKAKYYIQLTGLNDKYYSNQEHFGITLIEALNYSCIPICFSGGYSKYIIDQKYLIINQNDLYDKIFKIVNNEIILDIPEVELNNFTNENFISKFNKLINV